MHSRIKVAVCLMYAFVSAEYTNAQEYSRLDSLSILFQVYDMSGFDKGLFNAADARDTSLYIMYKPIGNNSGVHAPTHNKYKYLNIYFFRRADIIGFRITYWMVIDSFDVANARADLVYKITTSSDTWVEEKDEVQTVGRIKLELQNGKWVIVNSKIKRI